MQERDLGERRRLANISKGKGDKEDLGEVLKKINFLLWELS